MSKLIPEQLINEIPPLYATEELKDDAKVCHVKLFTSSNWSWYIIEISDDKDICFGYVQGLESELGYFSLEELESLKGPLGLHVEMDLSFEPTLLSKVKNET
ncbi:DUF2958 domain-containing protein [Sulfurimonas sp.]|uniref:DUF2958 domain-containing protein n=1 Tax=Sulfurimonas sp. TaxID=2022749 RepID=UPI0025ECE599|nr:DUF2958 domain-containing protein [Sulfurimonas sp.]